MRNTEKPVRKCHACLLNLGEHCWRYRYPRGQWRDGKTCAAFENEAAYAEFRHWQKMPTVKTGKELRREFFRTRPKPPMRRSPQHR